MRARQRGSEATPHEDFRRACKFSAALFFGQANQGFLRATGPARVSGRATLPALRTPSSACSGQRQAAPDPRLGHLARRLRSCERDALLSSCRNFRTTEPEGLIGFSLGQRSRTPSSCDAILRSCPRSVKRCASCACSRFGRCLSCTRCGVGARDHEHGLDQLAQLGWVSVRFSPGRVGSHGEAGT